MHGFTSDFTTEPSVQPFDEFNQTLVANVHPLDWVNPVPKDVYDLVVVGAGTAGLVVAAGAAGLGLGLKVALVERHLMGGDCLNVGCVPSKCVIRAGRVVAEMRQAGQFGVRSPHPIDIDFPAVMARMRRLRAEISQNDAGDRFRNLGVDVFLGQGTFTSSNTLTVQGAAANATLRFKKAVIATGARAAQPEVPGLAAAGYLTNETVFSLTERPRRLAVIGGGPIGCELAQAFHNLGCEVVLLHKNAHLLDREDADAAEVVQQAFVREGIQLYLSSRLERVSTSTEGKVLHFSVADQSHTVTVDEILVGAGRVPNIEGLGLERVGVAYDGRRGVIVNDFLQTTNPKIFAAGDICMDWQFTHAADAAARIVIKNALFAPFGLGKSKLSSLTMPWVTYTSPEIAHVGDYEQVGLETIKIPFATVDRAIADGETTGFLKIHYRPGSDQICGATIVANHAGEMISEITLAMVNKIGLGKIATVIHPYPTQAEAIKKAADAYRRTLLTARTRQILGLLTRLS